MSGLIYRKLLEYMRNGKPISFRFDNGEDLEGYVSDLDNQNVCINVGEQEIVAPISSIQEVRVSLAQQTVAFPLLHQSKNEKFPIRLTLKSGQVLQHVYVTDLDERAVLIHTEGVEYTVQMSHVREVVPANGNLTNGFPSTTQPISSQTHPSSPPQNESYSPPVHQVSPQPVYSSREPVSRISYSRIREVTAQIDRELKELSWKLNIVPQVIKDHPLSYRTNRKTGDIWSRGLNYVNNKKWDDAAQEFLQYANQVTDKYQSWYNVGVCWFQLSNFPAATLAFSQSIEHDARVESLLAGITCALSAKFYHRAIHWMQDYLLATEGTDIKAYTAIDFTLQAGLNQECSELIYEILEREFKLDLKWLTYRIAYLSLQAKEPPPILLDEVETSIDNGTNYASLQRMASGLQSLLSDKTSIEYRTAQQLEEAFLREYPSLNIELIAQLRTEAKELEKQFRFREAHKKIIELLEIIPDDKEANRLRSSLERRLRPPSYSQPNKRSNRSSSNNRSPSSSDLVKSARRAKQKKQMAKAKELYQKAIEVKADSWQNGLMDLAGVYLSFDESPKGIALILKHKDALDPNSSDNLLGALYYKNEDYDKSIEAYKRVRDRKRNPEDKIPPMLSIAVNLVRKGELNQVQKIIKDVLYINPQQNGALSMLEKLERGEYEDNYADFEIVDGYLTLGRIVGVGSVGIGDFLESELKFSNVTGLNRDIIEHEKFTLKDVNYLLGNAERFGHNKPEQVAQYCLSAAFVLNYLDERADDRFTESLRRFCAANADYFAINNFDVARTYYVESFRLEPTVTKQLRIKFQQIIMTFLFDRSAFIDPNTRYNTVTLLERGLTESPRKKEIINAILLVSRTNVDLTSSLEGYLKNAHTREAFIDLLCGIVNEEVKDYSWREAIKLIELGHQRQIQAENQIQQDFRFIDSNSDNPSQMVSLVGWITAWQPRFRLTGRDFDGTDQNRVNVLTRILRVFSRFYDESIFEEKDYLYNGLVSDVDNLKQNILDFPTYHGRCYILPILEKWEKIINDYFEEIVENAKPALQILEVEAARFVEEDILDIHLLLSNRDGQSAASNIKIEIIDPDDSSYIVTEQFFEVDKTLKAKDEITTVVNVYYDLDEPAFTLDYRLSYHSRQGQILQSEQDTIAVRLHEDETGWEYVDNPYATWANSSEVTDPNMFYGRDKLIDEFIKLYTIRGQRKMVFVYGQKRAGKSTILYHVRDQMKRIWETHKDSHVIPFKISLGDLMLNFTLSNFFKRLAIRMRESVIERAKTRNVMMKIDRPDSQVFDAEPYLAFIEYTEELIRQTENKLGSVTLLMIIDEFTYLYELILKGEVSGHFMKAWKALVEKHLFSFLLSGIDETPEFISAYGNEFAIAELKRVSYLDEESASQLIVEPISNLYFQDRAVERIMKLTANSAYYIQIFNNYLVNYMNEQQSAYVTEADVNAVMRRLVGADSDNKAPIMSLASNFDNLTRFKNLPDEAEDVKIEGRLLSVIATLMRNSEYANINAIYNYFNKNQTETVDLLIQRLIDHEVLKARANNRQYAIQVDLFKEYLVANYPIEE